MARPIADTPILSGKDAERFYERMASADQHKASNDEIKLIKEAYELAQKIMED